MDGSPACALRHILCILLILFLSYPRTEGFHVRRGAPSRPVNPSRQSWAESMIHPRKAGADNHEGPGHNGRLRISPMG